MNQPAHPPVQSDFDLDRLFSYRLSVLSNRISGAISREYHRRFGLAITEWRVMAVLGRFPGLSAGEVSARTAMDKVAVSRAVARLLERGLIQREIHDDDRRRSVLALSTEGVRVHDEVAPMVMEYHQRLFESFTPEERAVLDKLLDKLAGDGVKRIEG
ncbi:MarR family transcriptional regulator [Pseudoxanthomonas sangjuensis]|uniref:MarR family winged helix-turn-helix transcriptional regulator n=1 Tax=Pseudoxanthomonas sangjuensis TaxID=1503750 RepID=UPI0013914B46|nr:MarR family transcriptional regulator [Pseudoxanthomonas sangjuensis]KAF1713913.1 MarR family transcriptional regulator [Pseudoxanthomonas sangjuensis]